MPRKSTYGRLFNFRPALCCCAALALGVLFAVEVKYGSAAKAGWCFAAFFCFCLLCLFCTGGAGAQKKFGSAGGGGGKRFRLFRAVLLCAFFLCGAGDFALFAARYKSAADSGEYYVTARVEEAREYNTSVYLILSDVSFDYRAAEGKVCLYAYKTDDFRGITEGSRVAFYARITANTLWKTADESGGKAQTRAYYWRRDIKYEAESCKNLRVTGEDRDLFESIRFRLKQTLDISMDKDASALCFAILTGETADVDGALLDSFRYGGAAHIFAVSGLHVGALFAFVTAIFKKGRLAALPPVAKWAVAAAVIAFYGGICGFSAGVLRATVTCLVFYADKLMGVKGDSAESMGKAAIIVLLLSPVSLFDAGFLLSFSAVAGILMLSPALNRFFVSLLPQKRRAAQEADLQGADGKGYETQGAAQTGRRAEEKSAARAVAEKCLAYLAVTLSATLATAPVLSACFGYVSGVSLFLNVLIVPPVAAAFPLCLFIAFFSLIFAPLAQAALYVPSALFSALTALFYAFDFSRFALEIPFSALGIAAYYAALFSLSDKLNVKYAFRAAAFTAGFAALLLSFFL